jgi:8-oxo-dGTP pyrophosphatase MutT (NUDIX family)
MQPTRLNRTIIYESPWVNLYCDRVALSSGQVIEQYHVLDFGRGAVVVIVENDHGQVLLEHINRYPTGLTTWELPAGHIEGDETILQAARREVLEETGYETTQHRQLFAYYSMPGISNMTVYLVQCQSGQASGEWDKNEVERFAWFSRDELKGLIRSGEITDGLTLVGLLLFAQNLG